MINYLAAAGSLVLELKSAGFKNVLKFTWVETARKTKAVWESVARF